jgi:hypothetical protein
MRKVTGRFFFLPHFLAECRTTTLVLPAGWPAAPATLFSCPAYFTH